MNAIVDKSEAYLNCSEADYFYGYQKGSVKIVRIDALVVCI